MPMMLYPIEQIINGIKGMEAEIFWLRGYLVAPRLRITTTFVEYCLLFTNTNRPSGRSQQGTGFVAHEAGDWSVHIHTCAI